MNKKILLLIVILFFFFGCIEHTYYGSINTFYFGVESGDTEMMKSVSDLSNESISQNMGYIKNNLGSLNNYTFEEMNPELAGMLYPYYIGVGEYAVLSIKGNYSKGHSTEIIIVEYARPYAIVRWDIVGHSEK